MFMNGDIVVFNKDDTALPMLSVQREQKRWQHYIILILNNSIRKDYDCLKY